MPPRPNHRITAAACPPVRGSQILVACCLLAWQLTALTATAADEEPASAETLRITTYNIRYLNQNDGPDHWTHRASAVADVIRRGDIIGLQEATRTQIDDLRPMLTDFDWYGVGRDDAKDGGEFSPIFWRKSRLEAIEQGTFWLAPDPQAVGQAAWGARIPRICSWVVLRPTASESASAAKDRTLLVMNTHFDHQSEQARIHSARLLREQAEQLAGNQDVVVMGDLNARPDSEPLAVLTATDQGDLVLVDSIDRSETPPQGPTGTWNGFRQIDPRTRIDYILTRPDRPRVLTHHTEDPKTSSGRFASDHLPVSVTIKL